MRLRSKEWLTSAGDKPVIPKQMGLARLRAELARVKKERDNLKKRRRTSHGNRREARLDSPPALFRSVGHENFGRCGGNTRICRSCVEARSGFSIHAGKTVDPHT